MRQGCFSRDHVTQDLGSRSMVNFILKATGKRPGPKQEHDKIRSLIKRKTFKRGRQWSGRRQRWRKGDQLGGHGSDSGTLPLTLPMTFSRTVDNGELFGMLFPCNFR